MDPISTNPIWLGDLKVVSLVANDETVSHNRETKIAFSASREANPQEVPEPEQGKEKAYLVSGEVLMALAKSHSTKRVFSPDNSSLSCLFGSELLPTLV